MGTGALATLPAVQATQHWLVLHGGPGSGAHAALLAPFAFAPSAANAAMPSAPLPGLAVTAWAPHQRGSAPVAARRAQRVSLGALVRDLEALREALGLEKWRVLGGSWGAGLALAYASRYPQAVQRLVLRGSFMAGSADVWALLRCVPAWQRQRLRALGLAWPNSRQQVWPWLRQLRQCLDGAAAPPLRQQLTRAWVQAEASSALRGAARALRHAAQSRLQAQPDLPIAQFRAAHQSLRHDQRQHLARGAAQAPQSAAAQRRAQARVQAQVHLLGSSVSRQLRESLRALHQTAYARPAAAPPLSLLHGRFDAVCSPRNLRHLLPLASGTPAQAGPNQRLVAGHLGSEPAIALALRHAVQGQVDGG
jgi:proline iminopeptidase